MTVTDDLAPLLRPGQIGRLALRNRILLCPMGDNLAADDGSVSDRQLAYYEARARGGAALLLVGSVAVAHPSGTFAATQTGASGSHHDQGLRALADAAHRHGAAIAAQLVHGGPQSLHDVERAAPVLLPSPPAGYHADRLSMMVTPGEATLMASPFTQAGAQFIPRVASDDDLAWVIGCFASAARRCVDAGFDGIELHAGHGYLLDAFRSPATNRRDDGWGGDLRGRARLLLETIAAVRSEIGGSVPLWCRLNAVEHFKEPAETLAETLELATWLEAAGLDALHVSAYSDPGTGIGVTEAHTPSTPGALVEHARAVKARVNIPVITFGRLEPQAAADAIASGAADFVAMGRKLLADPDLPNKLAAGRVDDVRPCIYQYRCIGNIFVRGSVACVANADTAREVDAVPPAARSRRVVVVGAGPAGLEAAWRLAAAGHAVSLWDARARLGGRLALAARADADLDRFLGWLGHQVGRADIEIRLGVDADVAALLAYGADDIVVATGARWGRPPIEGGDGPHVRTLDDLLDDDTMPAGTVAVLGGGKVGCSLAGRARALGHDVTIIEPSGVFAPELGLPGRFRLVHDLELAGVAFLTATAQRIADGTVVCSVGGNSVDVAADHVVVAGGAESSAPLADALRAATGTQGSAPGVHVIGDAHEGARIEGAMRDARALTVALAMP